MYTHCNSRIFNVMKTSSFCSTRVHVIYIHYIIIYGILHFNINILGIRVRVYFIGRDEMILNTCNKDSSSPAQAPECVYALSDSCVPETILLYIMYTTCADDHLYIYLGKQYDFEQIHRYYYTPVFEYYHVLCVCIVSTYKSN